MHVPKCGRFNNSFGEEPSSPASRLPPLMDSSPYNSETRTNAGELSQVTCFSDPNQTVDQNTHDDIVDSTETPILDFSHSFRPGDGSTLAKANVSVSNQPTRIANQIGDSQYPDYCYVPQEQSMLRMLMENHGSSAKQSQKAEFAEGRNFDADISSMIYNSDMIHRMFGNDQEHSLASTRPVDTDCLWNY